MCILHLSVTWTLSICICVCQDILISKASETLKPAVSSSLHQNRLWLFPSGSQLLPTSGHITHRTSALQSHQCSGQKSLQLEAQLLLPSSLRTHMLLPFSTSCCLVRYQIREMLNWETFESLTYLSIIKASPWPPLHLGHSSLSGGPAQVWPPRRSAAH